MRTEDVSMFCRICELGSFTKAAEVLYASRNKCMRTVDSLEAELGCQLLERSPKGIKPTEQGEQFYTHAVQSEKRFKKMFLDLHSNDSINTIRFGYSGFSADKYIASVCAKKFSDQNPLVKVSDVQVDRNNAFSLLKNGTVDVLFAMLPQEKSELRTTQLTSFEYILLMNRNNDYYPENKILPLDVVKSIPLIFTMFSETPIMVFRSYLKEDFSDNIVYRTNDIGLIYRLVAENAGSAVLIVSDGKMGEAYSSDISMVSIEPKIKCPFGLIYTAEFEDKNGKFIEYMAENFAKEFYKRKKY